MTHNFTVFFYWTVVRLMRTFACCTFCANQLY